jgi:putative tricarboxylic transport membrane protein
MISEKLKRIHSNVHIGLLLNIIAVLFYINTSSFRTKDAATWPKMILVILMILSTALLLDGLKKTKEGVEKNEDKPEISSDTVTGVLIGIFMMIAYAILMRFTGFFVSTAIFLPASIWLLGNRNWKAIILVTAGMELFVYLMFVVGLKLRMP